MTNNARPVRIMVVANKTWEAAPLLNALFEKRARPNDLKPVARVYDQDVPGARQGPPTPRARFSCTGADIQIWCIEDWMDPGAGGSNTPEKMRVLPRFFAEAKTSFGGNPDAIVAFGTAGIASSVAFNGCVVTGTRVFVHDPYAGRDDKDRVIVRADKKTEAMWTHVKLDQVLMSAMPKDFFTSVARLEALQIARHSAEARFLTPPVHPGQPLLTLAGNGFASLGTINVTDYDDYVWADQKGLDVFRAAVKQNEVGSIETTHGLIRIAAEEALKTVPRFLYVSGMTDSLGYFDMEVSPRLYAQNYVAGHNAGVVLAWLLPEVAVQVANALASSAPAKEENTKSQSA